jgi:uncharacterized protein (TIGR02598 family)
LVEVTMALGIAAFCLIAIFGLLPAGLNSNRAAIDQTTATSIMAQIDADLRGTPKTKNVSPLGFDFTKTASQVICFSSGGIPTGKVGDLPITAGPSSSYFSAAVTLGTPSSALGAIPVNLRVTWPTAALPASRSGAAEITTALNRN